jgi:hypothetical protein
MYKRKSVKFAAFFGVKALYVKGIVPTDKLMILEYDINIPLFNLEDFGCEKYPNAIHRPIDEVRFFMQWVPEKIPHVDKCVRYPLMQNKTHPISWDHRMWMSNDESDNDEWR